MKRAVIYARVSSDDRGKEGRNLKSQLDMCRKYAKERQYSIVAELADHSCQSDCAKNENGKCLARVAHRYLDNNGDYMKDYEDFMVRDLPIGSGEAESGIRHIIKRRMAVAGAWEESNAPLLLALLAIRASGWWDDFWRWRARRDRQAWNDRQEGKIKVKFRGKRGKAATKVAA